MRNRRFDNISLSKQNIRMWYFMVFDIVGIALVYSLAILALKFTHVEAFDTRMAFMLLPAVIVLKIIVFYLSNLYKLILAHPGIDEVMRVFFAVIGSNVLVAIITLAIPRFEFIPEIYLIFTTFLEAIVIAFPRILKRIGNYLLRNRYQMYAKRTLLVGAGSGGKIVLNEILNNPSLMNQPIAFVDDDPDKIGRLMAGYKIYGPLARIPSLISTLHIQEVIICIANLNKQKYQDIINLIAEKPVKIKRLPRITELKKESVKPLIDVNVEDLLARDVVELDDEGINDFIEGKRVLVTGAGGSIGSELVRQIITYHPAEVILFDIYENGVYDLQMQLENEYHHMTEDIDINVLIGSVYNEKRVSRLFDATKPDLVFHAAAYKHVPLMEASAVEAVRTNVIGTYNICKVSCAYHVEKMVLVSSDKAVRPTNIMGATKRFAEKIIQYFDKGSETRFSAVRFGNVLGSNGSVVPLFKKQIQNGGPLTVTDKNIIRYFMTIPEAVGLILQSSVYAKGGEIFILDMGEPVKILDLAEKMIKLTGYQPYVDIDIEIIGLRPGEKLFEELLVDETKEHEQTANKKIFIEPSDDVNGIDGQIKAILNVFESLDNVEIKELVKRYVETYVNKAKKHT